METFISTNPQTEKIFTLEEVRSMMIEIVSKTIYGYDDYGRGYSYADDKAIEDVDAFLIDKELLIK